VTRKDWEKIEKVLRDARSYGHVLELPVLPSAESMRRRLAFAIADEFGITGEEQRNKFLKHAGVTYP
jgi:hypothetical protein